MNVLIVEPSHFVSAVLRNLCGKYGLVPRLAESGAGALDMLREASPDLIVMAYELGDMNGCEFFSRAKTLRNARGVPGVMFSGTAKQSVVIEALGSGVTECFSKNEMRRLEDFIKHIAETTAARFSGRVMLVEDSKTAAMFARSVLEDMGLTVDTFASAEQAIGAFAQGNYDLVLSDYVLAGSMSGLAVIRAIRDAPGRKALTPILAMSSLVDTTRKVEILRNGANDFVFKPVVPEELRARVSNLLNAQILMRRLEAQTQAMRDMAMHDQLTNLFNRHYLQDNLPQVLVEADRSGKQPCLAIIDIDHFKLVNDVHGHDVGDKVLVEVAHALLESAQPTDILARYGGEEFVLITRGESLEATYQHLEAMRQAIALRNPAGVPLTISIGVAPRHAGESYRSMFGRADKAVYQAKANGRNRVEINSEPSLH